MHDTTIPEKQTTFTPGPWHVIEGVEIRCNEDRCVVWELGPNECDAQLIAAAPDLLDACRAFVSMYEGLRDSIGPTVLAKLERADAAIAKATGLALLLLLFFVPSAQAQSRPFKAALGTYLIAASADLGTTEIALTRGTGREVLLGSGMSPLRLVVTKSLLATVLASETGWLASHRHPNLATWILILGSGLEGAAAIHNARVNR